MGKDKVRGKGCISRTQEENPTEEMQAEKRDQGLLAECKSHLSSIFVHWEPVFHLSESQSAQPTDKLDPSELDSDTAHLLTKWSLRWLLEDVYDERRTNEFLHWFEKAVIKHRKIGNVVTLDPSLKADLLQLYHCTFEARCHTETIQLFTNIMIRLLKMQGHLTEHHQAVVSACSPEHSDDRSRLEAGLFLLSLLVHELWSGATSAELFTSHVHLVIKTKHRRRKASKSSKTQTALRAICNDIIVTS